MKDDSATSAQTLIVWDSNESPPVIKGSVVVLWRNFGDASSPEEVSIPRLIELHADELRSRYLAWIYELGEMRIRNQRLVDHLELRPGFSYWWMTPFVEKCNYSKSPQIADAIRLMAFEKWVAGRLFRSLVLTSANPFLAECFRSWCANLGTAFEFQRMVEEAEKPSWIRRMCRAFPISIKALMWLFYHLIDAWPLRGVGLSEWQRTGGRITFFSYLFNLVPSAVRDGRFESLYWAHLPDILQRDGCKTNWLHLHVKDSLPPTSGEAANIIQEFNKPGQGGQQAHVTLDAFLSITVVIRTLFDWGRMTWGSMRLKPELYSPHEGGINLWPLFKSEWHYSMSGNIAMQNILFYNLFESALCLLPEQKVGVYLQENQGWEFALIHAWKAAGHGCLIGAPHSTVRYWDLRYFFDPRSYHRTGDKDIPLPDKVAMNGPEIMDVFLKGAYSKSDLVEVEALRYLYLGDLSRQVMAARTSASKALRVLVLGECLASNTQLQMRLLENAIQQLPEDIILIVKPHPACPIKKEDYPTLKFELTVEPISKLLSECDVAYTSNVTSASVDAYCAGVPVVSVLDPKTLNLSPLRGCEGVLFASTPEELANALIFTASIPHTAAGQKNFFTFDSTLPRWRKLLMESIG